MQKFLLPILILLSLSVIVILPNSFNICFSDGCNFQNRLCDNNACINETIMQHLSERVQLLSATITSPLFIILSIVLILFFAVKKYSADGRAFAVKFYAKQKLLNSFGLKLFNYLIEAFSNGIVHPRIY